MNINDIKQFRAGFEEGVGEPLPRGWLFLVAVKVTFMASLFYELIAGIK